MKKDKTNEKWSSNERKFTIEKLNGFMSIVWKVGMENKLIFIGVLIATALDATFSSILPWITSKIIAIVEDPSIKQIFLGFNMSYASWFYLLAICFLIMIALEYITNLSIGLFCAKIEIDQRNRILFAMVDQDIEFYFNTSTGKILSRLVSDTQGISLGIQQFLTNIIYAISGFASALAILFISGWYTYALISLAYTIVVIVVAIFIFIYFRRNMIIAFDIKRDIDSYMVDRINNISLIKTTGTEKQEYENLFDKNHDYELKMNNVVRWTTFLNLWTSIGTSFLSTSLIIMAVLEIKYNNDFSFLSGLFMALPYVTIMTFSIVMVVPTLRTASRATNSADRIEKLVSAISSINPNKDGENIEIVDSITLSDVEFSYPSTPNEITLPTLNIKFEKGKSYAFVGETGCGKSTISKLLLRFYDPTKGKVIINDNKDLKELNLTSYLSHIGYVEQEPQILYGDFIENVKYGTFDATDEEVIEACKKAQLDKFISGLKDGYNTILGQRGFLLSGGQKQRLVIARLFLKNPSFIILDEATSALDNIIEKEIQSELDNLIKGRTSVIIAHRLSTIKNVDQIIVLGPKQGIVQAGNWNQLIKQDGHFSKLYKAGELSNEK